MSKKILQRVWLCVGLIISLTLVACAPAAKKVETSPEPDIISRDGFYKDKIVGFSMTWPAEVFSAKDILGENERVRVMHAANFPVLTIAVKQKTDDMPPLAEIGGFFKDGFEESMIGSKRFNLRESKLVTLANGVEAAYAMLTWKRGDTFALVTVAVMVYKNGQLITVTATAPPGQPPLQVLNRWAMALTVNP